MSSKGKIKDKTKVENKPVGRPSKYDSEFCQMLIDHMREGKSIEAFAGVLYLKKGVKVCTDTVFQWACDIEEFSLAKKLGESLSRGYWDNLLELGIKGMIDNYHGATAIFLMKTRFGLKDGSESSNQRSSKYAEKYEKFTKDDLISATMKDPFLDDVKQ